MRYNRTRLSLLFSILLVVLLITDITFAVAPRRKPLRETLDKDALGLAKEAQAADGVTDTREKPERPDVPRQVVPPKNAPDERRAADEQATEGETTQRGTIFNGVHVPHIIDLSGKTFKEDIAEGYWLVDAFSPYCGHCKSLAPKYQTLHEFYYTSNPLTATNNPASNPSDPETSRNSFSRYFNIKFSAIDCVAFGSTCSEIGVKSFPSLILFKDGVEVKKTMGDRDIASLSSFIEECLELIRPGSRPKGGLKELPKAGAHDFTPKNIVPVELPPVENTDERSTVDQTGADAVAIIAPGTLAPKKPTIARSSPNPKGKSVALNATIFDKEVRKSLNPWFIKFYVPWCGHCQRLAPSWAEMARELTGKLDIGEVNCETEKALCREFGVRGYPSLKYIRGPERLEYEGLRGVGDLISWATKAHSASSGVQDVTAAEFEKIEAAEGVAFLYFYDHATTSEDMMALERLPLHLIGRAKLFKTNDTQLVKRYKITTWPKLLVSRSGKPTYFEWLMPQDIRDIDKVVNWMQSVWLPLVPELTTQNAGDILKGKFAVLAILNRERPEEMAIALREMNNAASDWVDRRAQAFMLERQELRDAKQLRMEEAEDRNDQRSLRDAKLIRVDMNEIRRKEVAFAWVDGIFWERYVRTSFGISVRNGERVIINDEDNKRYWEHTITGNPIVPSRTSILETLPKVVSNPPKLSPKPNGSRVRVALYRISNFLSQHRAFFIVLTVVTALGGTWLWLQRRGRASGGLPWNANGVGGNGAELGTGRRRFGTGGFFQLGGGEGGGRLPGGGLPNGKAD